MNENRQRLESPLVCGLGQCSWDSLGLVPRFPHPDSKIEVTEWVEQGGGPVATALVALRRLGVACRFAGVVGSDDTGRRIVQSLVDEGIDIRFLRIRDAGNSQKAFIAVEPSTGQRTIFWIRPSAETYQRMEVASDLLENVHLLLLDGLMAEASREALRRARSKGIPVMLDAGRIRPGMLEIAEQCDYVVASEDFARELGFDGDIEKFRERIKDMFRGIFTFTLGIRGSVTVKHGRILLQKAYPVDVIDTTGAGDVFHAGYIYGLLRRWDLVKILEFASAFAALKCRKLGGREGIPDLTETLDLVQRSGSV